MIPVITPIIAILLHCIVLYRCVKEKPIKRAYLYSIGSFTAALAAVCIEVHTIGQRAAAGDFGGIEDTMGAVLLICVGIAVVTVVLNVLALAAAYGER